MAEKPENEQILVEVISPLQQMAIVMHETYSAFHSAGFSEDQSMQIIMNMAEMGYMTNESDEND